MKKIITLLLGLSAAAPALAQNLSGNMHLFNDNTNHSLNLHYTIFTTTVNCNGGMQASGGAQTLPPGVLTTYTTFAASSSTATPPHPYPVEFGNVPQPVADNNRWHYIKFQMTDSNNPGSMTPTLGGSVGYFQNCTNIPSTLTANSTLNGVNYSLYAEAFTFGGDLWITAQ